MTHGAQRRHNNKTQDLKLIKENQKLNSRSKIIYLSHASLYEYNMGSVGCSAPEKDKWMDGFLNKFVRTDRSTAHFPIGRDLSSF